MFCASECRVKTSDNFCLLNCTQWHINDHKLLFPFVKKIYSGTPLERPRISHWNCKIWSISMHRSLKTMFIYPLSKATSFERPPSWVAFIEGFHCNFILPFNEASKLLNNFRMMYNITTYKSSQTPASYYTYAPTFHKPDMYLLYEVVQSPT